MGGTVDACKCSRGCPPTTTSLLDSAYNGPVFCTVKPAGLSLGSTYQAHAAPLQEMSIERQARFQHAAPATFFRNKAFHFALQLLIVVGLSVPSCAATCHGGPWHHPNRWCLSMCDALCPGPAHAPLLSSAWCISRRTTSAALRSCPWSRGENTPVMATLRTPPATALLAASTRSGSDRGAISVWPSYSSPPAWHMAVWEGM